MTKFSLAFALLAVATLGTPAASLDSLINPEADAAHSTANGKAPWFCHDLDCPKYEVKHTCDQWEERKYEQAKWVGISIEGHRFEIAATKGFAMLYKYLDGNNLEGKKVNMTTPVLTQFYPEEQFRQAEKNFTVAFFLPFKFQESPPTPRDRAIRIKETNDNTYYVASFSGFATEQTVLQEAAKLASDLDGAGKTIDKDSFGFLSYDPPYRLTKRHNEVAFKAASSVQSS